MKENSQQNRKKYEARQKMWKSREKKREKEMMHQTIRKSMNGKEEWENVIEKDNGKQMMMQKTQRVCAKEHREKRKENGLKKVNEEEVKEAKHRRAIISKRNKNKRMPQIKTMEGIKTF